MKIFNWLFGTRPSTQSDCGNLPLLSGGDGLSEAHAVIVNCGSMATANRLIDDFISERHGQKNSAWTLKIEATLEPQDGSQDTIRLIGIDLADGSPVTYYFNTSRPLAATMSGMKELGLFPNDS